MSSTIRRRIDTSSVGQSVPIRSTGSPWACVRQRGPCARRDRHHLVRGGEGAGRGVRTFSITFPPRPSGSGWWCLELKMRPSPGPIISTPTAPSRWPWVPGSNLETSTQPSLPGQYRRDHRGHFGLSAHVSMGPKRERVLGDLAQVSTFGPRTCPTLGGSGPVQPRRVHPVVTAPAGGWTHRSCFHVFLAENAHRPSRATFRGGRIGRAFYAHRSVAGTGLGVARSSSRRSGSPAKASGVTSGLWSISVASYEANEGRLRSSPEHVSAGVLVSLSEHLEA